MRVLIQFRSSPVLHRAARAATPALAVTASVQQTVPGLIVDAAFPPVQIPTPKVSEPGVNALAMHQPREFSLKPEESTYLVRGSIPDADIHDAVAAATPQPSVGGGFSDPTIESTLICPGSPPLGTAGIVAGLLKVPALARRGLTGRGVMLAIVDTGISLPYLQTQGVKLTLDVARSWTPSGVPTTPGNHPKNHGTMCAYDAAIAASQAMFLDYAVLLTRKTGQTVMSGQLSDAVVAYSKLLTMLRALPPAKRRMVVSNSW